MTDLNRHPPLNSTFSSTARRSRRRRGRPFAWFDRGVLRSTLRLRRLRSSRRESSHAGIVGDVRELPRCSSERLPRRRQRALSCRLCFAGRQPSRDAGDSGRLRLCRMRQRVPTLLRQTWRHTTSRSCGRYGRNARDKPRLDKSRSHLSLDSPEPRTQ